MINPARLSSPPSERLSVLGVNQSLWNLPELMRVQSQAAKGWIQRIEADLLAGGLAVLDGSKITG